MKFEFCLSADDMIVRLLVLCVVVVTVWVGVGSGGLGWFGPHLVSLRFWCPLRGAALRLANIRNRVESIQRSHMDDTTNQMVCITFEHYFSSLSLCCCCWLFLIVGLPICVVGSESTILKKRKEKEKERKGKEQWTKV